jgi:putative transposase
VKVSHRAQLRELWNQNANLNRMYADLALTCHALKHIVERKLCSAIIANWSCTP